MGITTIKRKIAAIALVCILAIIVLYSALSQTAAFAESRSDERPYVVCVTNHMDELYYPYDELMYFQWDRFGDDFNTQFSPDSYQDCTVVFDVKTKLTFNGVYYNAFAGDRWLNYQFGLWLSSMTRVCRKLKENGCYIMVIMDVDEHRLPKSPNEYAQFLKYVDMYINREVMALHLTNVIRKIKTIYQADSEYWNSEQTLVIALGDGYVSNAFVEEYLAPLYRHLYDYFQQMGQDIDIKFVVPYNVSETIIPSSLVISYATARAAYSGNAIWIGLCYDATEAERMDEEWGDYLYKFIFVRPLGTPNSDSVLYGQTDWYIYNVNIWLRDVAGGYIDTLYNQYSNWIDMYGNDMYKPMSVGEGGWMTSIGDDGSIEALEAWLYDLEDIEYLE